MLRKLLLSAALFEMVAMLGYGQGLNTNASKNDWEEINFEYNSAVLSDGYPSLLRLADLLKDHPAYRVIVEGNTDNIGSARANERLGQARANAVRDFLIKYGASANQITATTRGKADPKYQGYKNGYSRTDVVRWMNRRVVLTVTDEGGRTVSDGGTGEAIRAITQAPPAASQPNCCQDILSRLDKLDDIARMLQQLVDQNAGLRREVDDLKKQQADLEAKVNGQPKPLTEQQTTQVVQKQIEAARQSRFSLLGANVGSDANGNVTFTGKGRYFAPFAEHFAFQAEAEYLYFKTQREGQFDFGLVDRISNFQGGLFGSFKHVNLSDAQSGGTLGQAAITLDYLFKWGRLGIFGTKGFLNNPIIDDRNYTFATGQLDANGNPIMATAPNIFIQRYLSIVDQAGVSTTLGLWGRNYVEANIGYLRAVGNADRPGGTVRFIFPFGNKLAFTVEGGVNETLLGSGNNGRAVVGLELGNFLRPKDYLGQSNPVPADIPRVRYEVLSRQIHRGTSPPVADAGPNQIGVPAGSITLNGSNSHDPNGETLTFHWTQVTGPTVALSAPNSAITSFTAVAAQEYAFRLTVTNTDGQSASAYVTITTAAQPKVQIQFFIANPSTIQGGQSTTLQWKISNATSATLTPGPGSVNAQAGTLVVTPAATTTYTLTANNASGQAVANVTVVVQNPVPTIQVCTAIPMNINQGESATLYFNTLNATSVSISPGVGSVGMNGSAVVSPATSTTYTITATGVSGPPATCSVAVQVTPGTAPRIDRFSAGPLSIVSGQTSTLVWQVENATTVSISPTVGTVALVGTQGVTPTQTTTYTLTASNSFGTVTANASVTVTAPPPVGPVITSFTATPPSSTAPGNPIVLTCQAQNATSVTISGIAVNTSGSITVNPQTTTTYTCVATNTSGTQATQSLTVPVGGSGTGGTGPVVVISSGAANCTGAVTGGSVTGTATCETAVRQFDLSLSATSPNGNTPLTFLTTSGNIQATVLNPTSTTPTIQVAPEMGSYIFNVLVTDSKGNQTTVTLDVLYL